MAKSLSMISLTISKKVNFLLVVLDYFFTFIIGTNAKPHCKKLENVLQRQNCLSNDINKTHDKETSKRAIGSDLVTNSTNSPSTTGDPLVVLFSEKGRCHFCRLLCPDIQVH